VLVVILKICSLINRKLVFRFLIYAVAAFVAALNFNLFLVPNQIVKGGMSGLAIVVNDVFGMSIPLFLNLVTILLFILSLIMLDYKKAIITTLGGFFFNSMVFLSAPVALELGIQFQSEFLMLVVLSGISGICFGLIYRTGFNTGGSDAIVTILNVHLKIPMGVANTWTNIFIVFSGFLVFGPTKTLFAVFALLLTNKIIGLVNLGVKDSKMCFVKSKINDEIEDYLVNKYNMGVTQIVSKGGIFTKKEEILMVILPVDEYYGFKHLIKDLDPAAFILTSDCYHVKGGYKKNYIPF